MISRDPSGDIYVDALLRAYLELPATTNRARAADRALARSLFAQNVPLDIVQAAFLLAIARRASRPPGAPALGPIRSLHYFLPVIDQLRLSPPDPAYLRHLQYRVSSPRP